jgi:hypothetical protein
VVVLLRRAATQQHDHTLQTLPVFNVDYTEEEGKTALSILGEKCRKYVLEILVAFGGVVSGRWPVVSEEERLPPFSILN